MSSHQKYLSICFTYVIANMQNAKVSTFLKVLKWYGCYATFQALTVGNIHPNKENIS